MQVLLVQVAQPPFTTHERWLEGENNKTSFSAPSPSPTETTPPKNPVAPTKCYGRAANGVTIPTGSCCKLNFGSPFI